MAVAGFLVPSRLIGDVTLGSSTSGEGGSKATGQTGYSEQTNRSYLERQESAALEKARRIKEAMRQMSDSLDPMPNSAAKKDKATGISDGTWYSERLRKIQQTQEEREKQPGFMERIGNGLDSLATKGVREGRPWEVEEPQGFRPLQGLNKLANQVGETAQGLVTRPSNRGGGEERPHPEPAPVAREQVMPLNRPAEAPEKPVAEAEAAPKQKVVGSPAHKGESIGERLSNSLHLSARRNSGGIGNASGSSAAPQSPPIQTASAPVDAERRETKRVTRSESADPVAGIGAPRKQGGGEKFELEDVVPAGSGTESGGWLKGGGRAMRQGIKDAFQGGGHRSSPRSREEITIAEPGDPMGADASLFVVRSGEAEFYPFGGDASTPVRLSPGELIRVLKPGAEWTGVDTVGAGKGIIRTDQIRRAHEGEIAAGRVPEVRAEAPKKAVLPGSRIPMEIHPKTAEPEPPASKTAPKQLGDGLLPPLLDGR